MSDNFFLGFIDELCKLAQHPSEIVERKLIREGGSGTLKSKNIRHLFPVAKRSTPEGTEYETTRQINRSAQPDYGKGKRTESLPLYSYTSGTVKGKPINRIETGPTQDPYEEPGTFSGTWSLIRPKK